MHIDVNDYFVIGEYQQNICDKNDKSCVPCSKRLPSCIGLPRGDNPIPWKLWGKEYSVCYKNRTMDMKNCTKKYFHPVQRKCMDKVDNCKFVHCTLKTLFLHLQDYRCDCEVKFQSDIISK